MSRSRNGKASASPPQMQCAIYTRKSTEEGLDQDYNTLDAQRDSGEAFIKSQASEGWVCVPDHYDDGGFTGANMERPALKRLMADIESGKVNCVVVCRSALLRRPGLSGPRRTAICIGGQYYLFADYHPVKSGIRVGWFTSSSLDEPFTFCGEIGRGPPDPDIMFDEGRFYLATQMSTDYVSPGPWVETVEARVGVDTDKDGTIDQWSDWTEVKESYDYINGFSKQVARTPAEMDLSKLPAGYGFQIQLRLTDSTKNKSKPMIERMSLSFAE